VKSFPFARWVKSLTGGREGPAPSVELQDQLKAMADFYPEIDESSFPDTPPPFNPLSLPYMKRFGVVPLREDEHAVEVAMADPLDLAAREALRAAYGKQLLVRRAPAEVILQFLYRWYEEGEEPEEAEGDTGPGGDDLSWESPDQLRDLALEAPVIRRVNSLISRALDVGASDIHLEPTKEAVLVRYRIDGVLHLQEPVPRRLQAAVTSRIKLMAGMDIAEMRLPQDGRIRFKFAKQNVDIRVSTLPTVHGEGLVLRLLNQDELRLELDDLGLTERNLVVLRSLIRAPYGMVLVSGPTGSGKTTTLYAALSAIKTPDLKIVTVEDPVEYELEGINQVQVNPAIGLTFAGCLRSFLRQDPDVMLVGEIRDLETAEIAIQAALTGHLVFSTLHTNDAASAIVRLEDMGVERFLVTSAVNAVVSQRLVRRICSACKEQVVLADEERAAYAAAFQVPEDALEPMTWRGTGCGACSGTGYRGRIGIFEILVMDEPLQRDILRGAESTELKRNAVNRGFRPLKEDGLDKVRRGITTLEEVLRVIR